MTILNLERVTRETYNLNLEIPKPNHANFGTTTLRSYGPKTWKALPYHINTSDNLVSKPFSKVGMETIVLA